ncbi:MAG: MFS transporter [Acidobacteria bacterium]|nr:MFS transporter [Acidobacteriota bacterium]
MRNGLIKVSLFINYFLFAVLLNSVGTVILQVQNSFGVGERAASVLEAFKDLPIAITSFLVASFVVRIGYKRTMQIALVFIGLVCLVLPQVPTFWMVKLLFAATGVSFALIKVSVFATLGLVTQDQRGHASLMNFLESFFMVGVLSGYFIFSQFVDDQNPSSLGWVRVYYVLAAISFLALVLLSFAPLDESQIQEEAPTTMMADFGKMLALCARGLVLIFILSAFLYVLIEQSIMSWLPTFNSRILHLPASLSIEMASILAASTALGRFVAGLVLKRFDWLKVLVVGLVLAAVLVLVVLPLAQVANPEPVTRWANAPLAAFVFPCIGFCLAPIYPAINSVILSALPARQHAPMSGLIVVFSALGGTSGSLLMGFLFSTIGGKAAFYFSLLPLALLLFALFQFKRRLSQTLPPAHGVSHGG